MGLGFKLGAKGLAAQKEGFFVSKSKVVSRLRAGIDNDPYAQTLGRLTQMNLYI